MDPVTMTTTAVGVGKDAMKWGIKGAKALASAYGKRSISRLAKEAIFQFPSMFSADIDSDDIVILARDFERQYASFVVAAMSLDSNVDLQKYASMRDYLKSFHNNGNIPSAIYNSGAITFESALVVPEGTIYIDPMEVKSLWTCATEQYDTDILNNIYRPFDFTARKIANRIGIATEADNTDYDKRLEYDKKRMAYQQQMKDAEHARQRTEQEADDAAKRADRAREKEEERNAPDRAAAFTSRTNADGVGAYNAATSDKINQAKDDFYQRHSKLQGAKDIASGYVKKNTPVYHYSQSGGKIMDKEKFDTMVPTIVQVTVTNYTGSTTWNQTLTLGIKTMIRLVPSGQMVANMIDAAKDRAIFKFIKWTKGEIGLTDMLFGKNKYKKMGIDSARGKWLTALKKRATIDNVSKFLGARLLPNATIIITENEALQVKEATGLDLHNPGVIKKIMDKYFLLGFGIYDTETRILSSIIDGDTNYSQYPIRALAAGIKKEVDLLNQQQMRRF